MGSEPTDLSLRAAVETLLARYCRAIDEPDPALFASLWTEDAVFDSMVRCEGRAAILEQFEPVFHNRARTTKHLVTNVEVEVVGQADLDVRAAFLVTVSGEGTLAIGAGSYHDRIVGRAETWRFARKEVRLEVPITPVGRQPE